MDVSLSLQRPDLWNTHLCLGDSPPHDSLSLEMPDIVSLASLATKLWTHVPVIDLFPSAPILLFFFFFFIGSVSCFLMLDPVNILLCQVVGRKPSSTEGTRMNLGSDCEQTLLWPLVLHYHFSRQRSSSSFWEAPAAPLARPSPPGAAKHLQTTRTLQQHTAVSLSLHILYKAAALPASGDLALLVHTSTPQIGSGHL